MLDKSAILDWHNELSSVDNAEIQYVFINCYPFDYALLKSIFEPNFTVYSGYGLRACVDASVRALRAVRVRCA